MQVFDRTEPQEILHSGSMLHRRSFPDLCINLDGLEGVENTISTLHQLSLAIRKASNRNTLAKLPKLLDIAGDHSLYWVLSNNATAMGLIEMEAIRFDISLTFESYVRDILGSRWMQRFPRRDTPTEARAEIEDNDGLAPSQRAYRQVMFERCVSLITARRRQLAYFQTHQLKLAAPLEVQPSKDKRTDPRSNSPLLQTKRLGVPRSDIPTAIPDANSLTLPIPYNPVGPVSETVPSEFQPSALRLSHINAAPSTTASSEDEQVFSLGGVFDIPAPPEVQPFEKEKACPYCCLIYPRSIFTGKKNRTWRRHLVEDLQPFVCLFRNCNYPGKSYQSFKELQAHLNQPHYQDWQCPLHTDCDEPSTDPILFDTLPEFQDHLATFHWEKDLASTRSIVHSAGQTTTLPSWCFVCLQEQKDLPLLKHVVSHLKQAFLLALPARDDIKDSDAVSSRRSVSTTDEDEESMDRTVKAKNDQSAKTFKARIDFMNSQSHLDKQQADKFGNWNANLLAEEDAMDPNDLSTDLSSMPLSSKWRSLLIVLTSGRTFKRHRARRHWRKAILIIRVVVAFVAFMRPSREVVLEESGRRIHERRQRPQRQAIFWVILCIVRLSSQRASRRKSESHGFGRFEFPRLNRAIPLQYYDEKGNPSKWALKQYWHARR